MGLLVEARRLSAMGADGLLFASVSALVRERDLALVVGPAGVPRTALLLALCGRFALSGGSLLTGDGSGRRSEARLRARVAIAQAPPALTPHPRLKVGEVITERRLVSGRRKGSREAVAAAYELMNLERPDNGTVVHELDRLERILLSVALAFSQGTGAIAVADADDELSESDRKFVREALRSINKSGITVLASSAEAGWGDQDIFVDGDQSAVHGRPGSRLPLRPGPAEPGGHPEAPGESR